MLIQTSETRFYCSAPVSSTSFKKKKKKGERLGGRPKASSLLFTCKILAEDRTED